MTMEGDNLQLMQQELDREALVFRALGHPVRLGIVRHLSFQPETCACDFTEFFEVSQPTISAHLRRLREAGVVVTRRRGNQICYSLAGDTLALVTALLQTLGSQGELAPTG
jgi:DNA-binding transcriptional ArsR family regulator